MSKKMKWLTLLMSIVVAVGTIAGLIAVVQAANTNITSRLTYTYDVRDKDGNPVPPTGNNFTDGVFTVNINWNLSNSQTPLDTGDYVDIPFKFSGGINAIWMTDYTFDFTAVKPGVGTGVAGSATLSKVSGTEWKLRATFNDFLKNLNNLSGTFTLMFQLHFPDDGQPQIWRIFDTIIGSGTNPTPGTPGIDIGLYFEWNPLAKYGDTHVSGFPSGAPQNLVEWTCSINSQCMNSANFFNRYKGGAYNGTPPATIHVTDTLGPGQAIHPLYKINGPNWQASAIAPKDPAHLRYGGPGDTDAYFVAYTVDFRALWAYFADPANKTFIQNISGYNINSSDYLVIPGPDYVPPGASQPLSVTHNMKPGSVPFTPAQSSFIYMTSLGYGSTSGYSTSNQTKINAFCDAYLMELSPYMTNLQRTASGFSFDLAVAAIDGRALFMMYFSEVVNPAQLIPWPGDTVPEVTNELSISFSGKTDTVTSPGGYWLTGGGNAVGDVNTLTIFKKGDTVGDLGGAVFTVKRLGSNKLVTGGADAQGIITMTTSTGAGGTYSATTGPLGSYSANEIYEINETTPPTGYIAHQAPIYLKIDPATYAITLCDVNGNALPAQTPSSRVGLCDGSGVASAAGKNLFVTNTDAGTDIVFTNAYEEEEEYEIEIPVTKKITGTGIPTGANAETFTFQLRQVTGDTLPATEMIAGRVTAPQQKTVTVDQTSDWEYGFKFDKFTITQPGTYYFLVEEVAGSAPGWTYDPSSQRIITVFIDEANSPIALPGFTTGVIPEPDLQIDMSGNVVHYFDNDPYPGEVYLHAINPQPGYPRNSGFQYRRVLPHNDLGRRFTFRYMADTNDQLVSGSLYCIDRHTGTNLNEPQYLPITDPDEFTQYYRYREEILWLARNGFYALGVPKDVETLSATRRPGIDGTKEKFETIWVIPADAKSATNNTLGPNNLAEIKERFGVVTGGVNDLADLRQDEAYMCTQLAIFWFSQGFEEGLTDEPGTIWTPRPVGTDQTAQMLIKLFDRMVAAARQAVLDGGDDSQGEVEVSLGLDASEAVKSGEWYGPVKVKVAQLPKLFTAMENIKVKITPEAGYMVSTTRGGSAFTGTLTNGQTFYIKTGSTLPATGTKMVTAKATVPSGSVWNAWIFRYGSQWSNGGTRNPTNSQTYVAYGLYGDPDTLELDTEFGLLFNASTPLISGNLTFKNEFVQPKGKIEVEGKKIVTGDDVPDEDFTFKLIQVKNAAGAAYDGSGRAIERTVVVPTTGEDDSPYSFKFPIIEDLMPDTYYFKITETDDAVPGWTYDTDPRIITVVVDAYGVTKITATTGGSGSLEFTNDYEEPGMPFEFYKVDRNDNRLQGVKFELYTCTNPAHTGKNDHTAVSATNPACCWDIANPFATATSDSDGKVSFLDIIPFGMYAMAEVKTLTELQLPLGQWLIILKSDHTIEIIGLPGEAPPAFKIDDDIYFLPNYPRMVMPPAGGATPLIYTVLGVMTVGGAAGIGIPMRKRRRKKFSE